MEWPNCYRLLLHPLRNASLKRAVNKSKLAHFKRWKLMIGFFTRLWIVLRWLRRLANHGELRPLLNRTLVLTVKDLHFFLQLVMARSLVRLSLQRRRVREESLKREVEKRRRLVALRRLAKRPSVK